MNETITFYMRTPPPDVDKIQVTGKPISLAGIDGFAVHQKPEDHEGREWRVTHIETGAMVSSGDTERWALAEAHSLASSPEFPALLKLALTTARKRISYFEGMKRRALIQPKKSTIG